MFAEVFGDFGAGAFVHEGADGVEVGVVFCGVVEGGHEEGGFFEVGGYFVDGLGGSVVWDILIVCSLSGRRGRCAWWEDLDAGIVSGRIR